MLESYGIAFALLIMCIVIGGALALGALIAWDLFARFWKR